MVWPLIFTGDAPNDGKGTPYRTVIMPALARLFTRLTGVGPAYQYSFSSTNPTNSILHAAREELDLGGFYSSVYADTNRNAGSGATWEVIEVNDTDTAWVASTSGQLINSRFVVTGSWAKFALVLSQTKINVAQMFVNTKQGTAMQGRIHMARDLAGVAAGADRKEVIAQGQVTIGAGGSDGIDMRTANFDFSDLKILENPASTPGYLLRVGDPDSGGVLGLADHVKSTAVVVGTNMGPNATSGPNGTKGYDFQGRSGQDANSAVIASQAIGVLMANCDSVEERTWDIARCKVGLKTEGNTEKQKVRASIAFCDIGFQDYTVKGSPDTNFFDISFNSCSQLFVTGEDSTGHLKMNAEGRMDTGASFPAAYNSTIMIPVPAILNSNGKRWKYSGESRGSNSRVHFYFDRLTSTSIGGQGSDTAEGDNYSTVHQYGNFIVADRIAYLLGHFSAKDNGPGRLNKADDDEATCAQLPGGCFEINRIDKSMADLHLNGVDIYNEYGIVFGDPVKNLKSVDKRIGSVSIFMRETSGYASNLSYANRDMKFIKGALLIRAGDRLYVPMKECNHNVVLDADCKNCTIELPSSFVTKNHNEWDAGTSAMVSRPNKVIKDAAATANIEIKGSLTAADMTAITWAFEGVSVEKVSDRGGRPAAFIGGSWKLPAYSEAL